MDIVQMQKLSGQISKFAKNMQNVLKFKTKLQIVRDRFNQTDEQATRTVSAIKQLQAVNNKPTNINLQEMNDSTDRLFVQSYMHIQEGLLQIAQVA